ncbi:MAG: ABC transporter permease [Deltaproteobacteria bacterium]|nr:MAG: ABC transporter permease [Deltaproteobacteria bacterium]
MSGAVRQVGQRIAAIALNTFRDAIRHRVLYGVAVVVLGFNLFGIVLGEMSLNEEGRVARDVGLAGVSLFGAFTAIYLGVSLLYNEIQRKTIYTILTKPIARWEFVLGKYVGMCITLTLLVALFAVTMVAVLWLRDMPFGVAMTKAIVLAYMEVLIVAAVAIFFSSFSTPFLSGVFTFAIYFLGRVTPEMRALAARDDFLGGAMAVVLRIIPDLHLYAVSGSVVEGKHVSIHGDFVSWGYVASAYGFGILYAAALLLLAIAIFSRRNFA